MDMGDYLQYMLALVFVLALIGLIAVGVKRFGIAGTIGGRRSARIAILEAAPVDKRRRLLLIRRDNVEHLVMVGGNQDFVVESGIEHDPNNKFELGSPLHSVEPPLTSREPVLQAEPAPKRSRRSTSARQDTPPAEPKLDVPPTLDVQRAPSANDQQVRAEAVPSGEPDAGRAKARKPEQPPAEMPAAQHGGDHKPADAGSRPSQSDRAPQRNAPTPPLSAGSAERAPAAQENYGPDNPIRVEPKLHVRSQQAGAESNVVRPEPKAQLTVQPKAQRRPAEKQQERAPVQAQVRQTRPPAQTEVSQRTRPQTPTAQPAAGQRVAPTIQTQQRQPSRQPQAMAGNDPDLLILDDPVSRPRRA